MSGVPGWYAVLIEEDERTLKQDHEDGQVVTNSERHLGLFWSKGHPKGGFEDIRLLSAAEETELSEAMRILRGFVNRPAFVLQIEMYRSVMAAISSLAMLPVGLGPNQANRRDAADVGNRLTLWLEATRMFLNQTETFIKRGYGKDSSQWSTWKTLKQRLHSSHLGYDLLYEVRNSLHSAAVPLKITVATTEVAPDDVTQSLDLTFDVVALRKDDKLKRWFGSHSNIDTASLDVQSLVTEMQGCMEELKRAVMLMGIEAAREATRTIRKYSDEAFAKGDPSSSWPITFKVVAGEPPQISDLTFLPIDLLDYVPVGEPDTLIIRGSGVEEVVGQEALLRQRSTRSWEVNVEIVGQRDRQSATGEASLWAYTTGSGWGGTVILADGYVNPGPVLIRTAHGHDMNATLATVAVRAHGEAAVIVGTLIGLGPSPSQEILTHPYRDQPRPSSL